MADGAQLPNNESSDGSAVLALIQTGGTQRYIFGSNKLREQIGASELVSRVGDTWLDDALNEQGASRQGRLSSRDGIEVIVGASGKALLACRSAEQATAIVRYITARGLVEAPGLEIHGIVSEPFPWGDGRARDESNDLHRRIGTVSAPVPSQLLRFGRLPIGASCATSPFPAARRSAVPSSPDESEPVSHIAFAKRAAAQKGWRRMTTTPEGEDRSLPESLEKLEALLEGSWVGIFHADGNGLGRRFAAIGASAATDDEWAEQLREFSNGLELRTQNAFDTALGAVTAPDGSARTTKIPAVPFVLGGDDITVALAGNVAEEFATQFLLEFADGNADDNQPLTASGGLVFTKSHFPVHASYHLAEELLSNAKRAGRDDDGSDRLHKGAPLPLLDFHVLRESVGGDLATVREPLRVGTGDDELLLAGGPYWVVVPDGSSDNAPGWPSNRTTTRLREIDTAVNELPRSPVAAVKAALFSGRTAVTNEIDRLKSVHDALGQHLDTIAGAALAQSGSQLLDVLELADVRAGR